MTAQYTKPWLQPAKFIRNGKYPDAVMQSEMSGLGNHLSLYRLKEIASFGMGTTAIPSTGVTNRWRTHYTPSPYAKCVVLIAWMAPAPHLADPTQSPYAEVTIDNGTDTGTAQFHYGAAAPDDDAPDNFAPVTGFITDADGELLTIDTSTTYTVTVTDHQSRIAAISIYEGSFGATAPFSEGFAATTPILNSHQQQLIVGARNMWKRQAAPLFSWSVDVQASPRSTTSDTAKNLIDDSSTTVATSTPGFTLDLRNRARVSTGTVSCRLWVYGSSTDEGHLLLKDASGTEMLDIAFAGAAGWHSDVVDLPATLAKYDLQYYGTAADTTTIGAVVLEQYVA